MEKTAGVLVIAGFFAGGYVTHSRMGLLLGVLAGLVITGLIAAFTGPKTEL